MKHGIIRNGEHVKLCDTKEEAVTEIEQRKAQDQKLARDGWFNQESADEVWYRIVQVKRMPW